MAFALNREEISTFITALQISIDSQIVTWSVENKKSLRILFDERSKTDPKLKLFEKILPGKWDDAHREYIVSNISEYLTPLLINFLMLTRLDQRNILKIKNLASDYAPLAQAILSSPRTTGETSQDLDSLSSAADTVFSLLKQKQLTIRELAEKTGLSMVAISNFKAGNDIRLSNFIKIAEALGLKVKLESNAELP